MKQAVIIRDILWSDKRPIMEIVEKTGVFPPLDVEAAEEVIDEYLSSYHFSVAEVEGQVAGYVCYVPASMTQGTWEVYWMAISPVLQGRGVGKKLLRSAEEDIRRQGGRMILIETSSTDAFGAARLFYEGQGYDLVSTIPDFYSPGDNKEIFRKVL